MLICFLTLVLLLPLDWLNKILGSMHVKALSFSSSIPTPAGTGSHLFTSPCLKNICYILDFLSSLQGQGLLPTETGWSREETAFQARASGTKTDNPMERAAVCTTKAPRQQLARLRHKHCLWRLVQPTGLCWDPASRYLEFIQVYLKLLSISNPLHVIVHP